jgi:WD40 repeat protein
MCFIANNQLYTDLGSEIVSVNLGTGNVTRRWLKDSNKQGLLVRIGRNHFASSSGSLIELWNMDEKKSIELKGHTQEVTSISSLNANRIATSSMDGTVKIWGLEDCVCTQTITLGDDFPYTVSFLDEKTLIIGTCCNSTIIYDLENSSILRAYEEEGIVFFSTKLSNGNIVTGDWAGNIKVYDSNHDFIVIQAHDDYIMDIQEISPGFIVSVSLKEEIKIWNTETWQCEETILVEDKNQPTKKGEWSSFAVHDAHAFIYTRENGLLKISLE